MNESDVLKELRYWLDVIRRATGSERTADVVLMQRASDEIEALREKLSRSMEVAPLRIRAEALEEAAQVCINLAGQGLPECGVAVVPIRALKEKSDD